jgi:phosphomannomutase/phosphoglucomutase
MGRVGHSVMKSRMKEEGALLAGEVSGHIFFGERFFGFDDAIYAGARLLEILSRTRKRIGDLLEGVPGMVSTPEIRLDCPDNRKFGVVEKFAALFRESNEVIEVDGARVLFDGGWGLVRASNTQPMLVFRFEAESEAVLERIQDLFMDHYQSLVSEGI